MEYYVAVKSKGYSDYIVTLKMYMIVTHVHDVHD